MKRIAAATAAIIAASACATGGVALAAPSARGHQEHSCQAQMRVLREVSRESGITIGSAFIDPKPGVFHPRALHRALEGEGLLGPARAVAVKPFGIGANQAFVRSMTNAASAIISGKGRCGGGLPLT